MDTDTSERLRVHLDGGCPRCAARLTDMERIRAVLPETQKAPLLVTDAVRDRVRTLFRERFPQSGRSEPHRQLPISARLLFGGGQGQNASIGTRDSGGSGKMLQFLYEADTYQIDLWAEQEAGNRWYLIGQTLSTVTSRSVSPTAIVLIPEGGDSQVGHTATAEAGEFHFPAVPTGTYILRLEIQGQRIEVANLEIGQ